MTSNTFFPRWHTTVFEILLNFITYICYIKREWNTGYEIRHIISIAYNFYKYVTVLCKKNWHHPFKVNFDVWYEVWNQVYLDALVLHKIVADLRYFS